jgi:hypothetical protein
VWWHKPTIPSRKPRWEGCKFEASLGYINEFETILGLCYRIKDYYQILSCMWILVEEEEVDREWLKTQKEEPRRGRILGLEFTREEHRIQISLLSNLTCNQTWRPLLLLLNELKLEGGQMHSDLGALWDSLIAFLLMWRPFAFLRSIWSPLSQA